MEKRKTTKALHNTYVLRSNNLNCTATAKVPKGFPIFEALLNDEAVTTSITYIYEFTISCVTYVPRYVFSLCDLRATSNAYNADEKWRGFA